MRPLAVSDGATLLLNITGWGAAHALTGYAAHRLPLRAISVDTWWTRPRRLEQDGAIYRRIGVHRWKDRLPEAGAMFAGGMSKRRLGGTTAAHLVRFQAETRRAEYAHVACAAFGPLFALWNTPAIATLLVTYGIAINTPFVLVQRYNRARITDLLTRRSRPTTSPNSARGHLPTGNNISNGPPRAT